jgi:glycerol-3-phosphate dehydrogenase (NAD(P)+)
MARARRIDMPIAEAVADILAGRISIQESIDLLLMRPLKTEYET